MSSFRPGSIGALMDEYERAVREMRRVLESMSDEEYEALADPVTQVDECRTAQKMMRHAVSSGYSYANSLRTLFEQQRSSPTVELLSRRDVMDALDTMVRYTDETVQSRYTMSEQDMDKLTVMTNWGVAYSVDQLLEHAVMHIHRHRRQLEKFILALRAH